MRPPAEDYEDAAEAVEGPKRQAPEQEQLAVTAGGDSGGKSDEESISTILEETRELLQAFREKGIEVEIRDIGRGKVAIYLLPHDSLESAAQLVEFKTVPRLEVEDSLNDSSSVLDTPCANLDLSLITLGTLTTLGVTTIRQLTKLSPDDLLAVDGFGDKSLGEIREQLMFIGFRLKGD